MRRGRDESGQSTVVVVLFMAAILGMAALVIDVGGWFRGDRAVQATADAAALAGAQALPGSPGQAKQLALDYADKNGGGVTPADVTVSTTVLTNDTITVTGHRTSPGFFARVFGVSSATAGKRAVARAGNPAAASWAAPIGVDEQHPLLSGGGCPCFNQPTTLDMYKVGPGAFRLLNIDGSVGGTLTKTVGSWIQSGYNGSMPLAWYYSNPGIKPNSSNITSALNTRIGSVLLFPVYRQTQAQGAGFNYNVVGWVGFKLTGYLIQGTVKAELYGQFTSITWDGILSGNSGQPDFGSRIISLIQ